MVYKTQAIIDAIRNDFAKVYKTQRWFEGSGMLWDECINSVKNEELMSHIVFCNDIMEIPPVKTFLKANIKISSITDVRYKKALGAFWGFVFKFVFNYQSQKDGIPINTKGVRKSKAYYNCISKPIVTK